MKVAQYVANFVAGRMSRIYGVCGAGAMHLNDAMANHPDIEVISMQHEQAAAMAAEAATRVTGKMSAVMVTAGPGGTNTLTGVACAYVDSIPMLVIAGQVTRSTMSQGPRQVGMNELPMCKLMGPITKYAQTISRPEYVRYILEDALWYANEGRKGPVFVEIPLDVQAAEIDPDELEGINLPPKKTDFFDPLEEAEALIVQGELQSAKRPLVIVGNGVRLAGAIPEFRRIFDHLGVPVVSSWGAADIMPTDHPFYVGRCGIFGDRASNFAVQSADYILAIGTRLTVAQIGHTPDLFAPQARKVIVDIDRMEKEKGTTNADRWVIADAKDFLSHMWQDDKMWPPRFDGDGDWLDHCANMKRKYPSLGFNGSEYGIGSYEFVRRLSDELNDEAIVVTDVGFCFIPTFQAMKLRTGQRLIHSAGVSPMGWGLPAAIGASFASDHRRQVICLTGDGGLMMNLQELQTIRSWSLPVAIFVFENGGYATMKIAQNNHFKREVMAGPESGLNLPEFVKIAKAFGIFTKEFYSIQELSHDLPTIMDIAAQGPIVVVMHMDQAELIAPRLQARMEDGKFVPVDLSDMWPHLPKEEIEENMRGVIDVVPDRTGSKILAAN